MTSAVYRGSKALNQTNKQNSWFSHMINLDFVLNKFSSQFSFPILFKCLVFIIDCLISAVKEKVKTKDFSDTFSACDLKVGRCRQLIEFMNVCEYSKSVSFFDLSPRSFTYKN